MTHFDSSSNHDPEKQDMSRRKWLRAAAAISIGRGLLAPARTEAAENKAGGNDLGTRIYNVRDFGAKGDGSSVDTAAVQDAIDACNRDRGGTVLVPAGVFVIGTVEMKSNVTLHIAAAGTLMGSADGKDYRPADAIPLYGDATLNDGNVGLLFAVQAENIAIEGPGTIDGQGAQFRSPARGAPPPSGRGGNNRPYHLLFHQCKNLSVRDIFLTQSAYHSVRIIQSSYVKLDHIRIYNRVNHNNDGFHFISAQHVHLSNCTVECQDDACALFGSCKFVTVSNCSFSTRWSVFRFGGGEAENITVSNCLIHDTYGCPIKMRCGPGSRFENISFSNLVMSNVTGPISIGVGGNRRRQQPAAVQVQTQNVQTQNVQTQNVQTQNQAAAGGPPIEESTVQPMLGGVVRNISFRGIRATVAAPVPLPDVPFTSTYNPGEIKSCIALNRSADGVLENITFDDVHVTFPGGGTAEEAAVRDVPMITGEYYENGVLPAYGVFARNVRALTLSNVRLEVNAVELRPALVLDHVEDAVVNGFSAQANPQAESLLRLINTQDVLFSAVRVLTPAAVFLAVEGPHTRAIIVDGGNLAKAVTLVSFKAEASRQSVTLRV
jgi:hypothetical protein